MKRLLRVMGVLVLILVAAMLLLPIVFKDEIIARAKLELNETLNAKVGFEDIGLSMFRSFPDFTLSITGVTIDGINAFEGVRLAEIDRFQLDLDLMSVVSGNQFKIEKVLVADGHFHILLDADGNANYDIIKPSAEDQQTPTNEESSTFNLSLKNYTFKNIDLVYDDPAGAILVHIHDLDHSGSGDFTQNMVSLKTETRIKAITIGYEGVNYLSSARGEMDADFMYDQDSEVITFGDNLMILNDLPLEFTGAVSIPDDKINMDLSFRSPSEDIKKILSLLPAIYVDGYEDMKASGSFQFSGTAKGEYDYEDQYPQYDLNLVMKNGSFNFSDLPSGVENINIEANIFNRTSKLEGLEIKVPVATASVAGSPIEARIILADPMDNPKFDLGLIANLDLADLSKVVPMQGYLFKGKVDAEIAVAGDMDAVENNRCQDINAEGFFEADSLELAGDSMSQVVRIDRANLSLSPQYLDVQEFVMLIGNSDFRMRGRVDNVLSYLLNDEILIGRLTLDADMINLNELSSSDSENSTDNKPSQDSAASLGALRLPQNIDFALNTSIRQLVYDDLMINDVVGQMTVTEGIASMKQLDMRMLGGRVRMSGTYNSVPDQPTVDLNFDLRNFDVRETYQKIGTIQQLAPIMKSSSGIFNTKLNFKSLLNNDMSPNLESIVASGGLSASSLSASPKVMQQLSDLLKNPKLAVMALKDINLNYRVNGGRVEVDPFNLTSGSLKSVVSGSMGLDKSLDYTMDVSLPLKDIGAANLLSQLGGDPNQKVDIKVLIGGTASNPKIKTSLKDLGGSIVDQAIEDVKEKVEEVIDDAIEQANAKAAQLIADAEKRGDELIADAQKQADALVTEAEKQAAQLREEANKQARKLEDDAKGNFIAEKGAKIAADKLREEGDEKATQLVAEARKKANGLVEAARKQKVKLVEEAQEKAKIQ